MASTSVWRSDSISVAGVDIRLRRGGAGWPVIVLHRDTGTPESLQFFDLLAEHFEVIVPFHPGFGRTEQPAWMRSVRDVAVLYRGMLGALEIGNPSLVGLGFGGWIAAEMATFAPASTSSLVLVGAMGVKPPSGHIEDQALLSYIQYVRKGFADPAVFTKVYGERPPTEQLVAWDKCRETSFRLAWRPYMYSDTLPYLLPTIRSRALVVWGESDAIVPESAGQLYASKLRDARLERMSGAGHCIEMEQPVRLARLIRAFVQA
jgi:pimeloyl-ACP methyl ester carboxylesterase